MRRGSYPARLPPPDSSAADVAQITCRPRRHSALQQIDLSGLLLALGVGLPACRLLFLGAWSSNVLCLYSSSLSLATIVQKLNYRSLVVIIGTLGTLLALVDAQSYLVNFLVLLGSMIPPIGAIYLLVVLLLHPGDYAARAAAPTHRGTRWRALAAWLGATALGLLVHAGQLHISGVSSIDAILASALLFLLLNRSRIRAARRDSSHR
jgi:cytosine permease